MRCWVVINHRNLPTCHIPKGLGTLNATVARTSRRASVSLGDYGCAGGLECRYRFYRRYFNPSGLYLTRALRAMDDCSSLYNHYSTPERSQVKRRRPRRVQNQPKATTSAHTFRDGDVSQQDIFRLLLASCRKRSNCIEKLRPYSSDIGCHAKRFSRRDRDSVRR